MEVVRQNNDRRHMFRAMFIGWKITFFSGGTFPGRFFVVVVVFSQRGPLEVVKYESYSKK